MPNFGYGALNQRTQRVNVDHFSMVPRADIPRSTFTTEHTHKTTFDGGYLYPILVDEVLPGDSIQGEMTHFVRMNTLLFPLMDHVTLESFFFFVPNRIVWVNWRKLMGERDNPTDSISYVVPQMISPTGGWAAGSLWDYMGIPGVGQIGATANIGVNALPIRGYAKIWNEWFRDENLQTAQTCPTDDGPDPSGPVGLLRRNKKHDYFTSALPWPLKNNAGISLPLSGTAPVFGIGIGQGAPGPTPANVYEYGGVPSLMTSWPAATAGNVFIKGTAPSTGPEIYADLSSATGATISALRLAVQTQRLLERDARGGTRYTELLRSHFGVIPEDARLQRPEYVGGGRSDIQTSAIPQTSPTGIAGTTTPLAGLGGQSTITGRHHFSYHATEHGFLIGLVHVDAELTYQQGLHRMWTRTTRYDYYWPVFAHLSEQPIRNDEIYVQGGASDAATFGYQERWAEYRHRPSRISGMFRSTTALNIDPWHAAQKFASLPVLGSTFIRSDPPFARNLAAGSTANGMQFLGDFLFRIRNTRAMPMYSVPGGMDRF